MAFGFIKKVFSFGRKDEPKPMEAEAPAAVETTDAAALPEAIEALPAPAEPETQPSAETPAPAPAEPEPVASGPEPIVGPVIEPEAESRPIVEAVIEPQPTIEDPVAHEPDTMESASVPDIPEPEPEAPAPAEPEVPGTAAEPVAETPAPESDAKGEAEDTSAPPSSEIPAIELAPPPTEAAAEPETPAPVEPKGRVTVAKTVEAKAEPTAEAGPAPRAGWFQRLRAGLARSSSSLTSSISGVFTKKKLDEDTLQDLEDVLISADLGVQTALAVTDTLASTRLGRDVTDAEVRAVMAAEIEKVLAPVALPLELDLSHKPHVILVVGVNGTGKTTTIGKLAAKLVAGGLKVTLAAGDTFRAAAIEQLHIWGSRTGSTVVSSRLGADAAGLAYDAFEQAKAEAADVLIIDTAGRLQNKAELMDELAKIVRVLGKLDPEAPHTVLQTLDATTGQNAMNQVEIFRNVAGVNGLVMTKLDGTARGGILVAIAAKHRLPVYFIGVGEAVDDLEPFAAKDFAAAIAGVQA